MITMFTLPLTTAICIISWTVLTVTILILLIITVSAIIHYHNIVKKEIEKEHSNEKPILKICYNAADKVFSLNGLISILFISAIVLVFYTISNGNNDSDTNLTILTISFTLAAIVPYIIGRSIANNEVEKIVDEKFKARFDELSAEYSTSLFSLRKNNAHTRRIAANLLKRQENVEDKEWAIGWAAEAIIGYALIHPQYDKSAKYAKECIEVFRPNSEGMLMDFKPDSLPELINKDKKDIHERTLKSILSMHAITDIYNFHDRPSDMDLQKIEHALFMWVLKVNNISSEEREALTETIVKSCKVSDIPDTINIKVMEKVKGHLMKIITEEAKL